jgi:acetyl esterase/lipase
MRTNRLFFILSLSLFLTAGLFTAQAQKPRIKLKPTQTLLLYPEGQNVDKGLEGAEGPLENNGLTGEYMKEDGNLYNTGDSARIDLYLPKKCNGKMIIVCPGGGYRFTSTYNEGLYVANYMLKRNIAVCVVKYRMPNGHWQLPLHDVQNAFRYCRANAEKWGVKQIGVIGFSAGGHLASTVSTMYKDAITKPDFSILIYPVITFGPMTSHGGTRNNLIGKKEKWDNHDLKVDDYNASMAKYNELVEYYSTENRINAETPKTFIAVSQDDKTVPVANSIMYYEKLTEHKVPAALYIFPTGGHGWGFSKTEWRADGKEDRLKNHRSTFEKVLDDWMNAL